MADGHVWQPLSVDQAASLLEGLAAPWWFAGGQAIDAFLGYESRNHGDIDVACLRRDQLAVQRQLRGWELWCAGPPGVLRPWIDGEWLDEPVHDIWCRRSADDAWRLQLMLDEADGDVWVYRRNHAVRRSLDSLTFECEGRPFLTPEVQLLYKAPGAASVAKNEADFTACLPRLEPSRRAWLTQALTEAHPGHPWLARLANIAARV